MTMMDNGSETREVVLGHEIDDLLLGLRGLVLVGDLRRNGAQQRLRSPRTRRKSTACGRSWPS